MIMAGHLLQCTIVKGRIRERESPTPFEEISAQIQAFIERSFVYSTLRGEASVPVGCGGFTVHKTFDLESECNSGPGTAEGRIDKKLTSLFGVGDVYAVKVYCTAFDP